jgi:quinol monooxygenase YgiN
MPEEALLSELYLIARFSIQPGKLDVFRDLASQCMDSTRKKDAGTLQYDWFFNDDRTECIVLERYLDSNAILEHAANLGDLLADISSIGDPVFEIYGHPTDELIEATSALPFKFFRPFQSL